MLEEVLAQAHGAGLVHDAAIAQSGREAQDFWFLRENIPRAQRLDGASLKHDISVPVAALPQFVEQAADWVSRHVPEGRLIAYGHVGDGNLHFNLNQDPRRDGRGVSRARRAGQAAPSMIWCTNSAAVSAPSMASGS